MLSFLFYSDARNMAKDVHSVLEQIIMQKGNMDEAQAEDYIKKLQNKGRYSSDVWSWGWLLFDSFTFVNILDSIDFDSCFVHKDRNSIVVLLEDWCYK